VAYFHLHGIRLSRLTALVSPPARAAPISTRPSTSQHVAGHYGTSRWPRSAHLPGQHACLPTHALEGLLAGNCLPAHWPGMAFSRIYPLQFHTCCFCRATTLHAAARSGFLAKHHLPSRCVGISCGEHSWRREDSDAPRILFMC